MNMAPNIITTLVGGPCNGQTVQYLLFDGRTGISVFKQVPAQVTPYDEEPNRQEITHHYTLRQGRYPQGGGFVVFAHPDLSDAEVFLACKNLQKFPPTEALWNLA